MFAGAAMLTPHSRSFRHTLQFARYRYGWLSKGFEQVGMRVPARLQAVMRRTRPDLVARHTRRRAARAA